MGSERWVNFLRFWVQKYLIPLTFNGLKALVQHLNLTLNAFIVLEY